MSDNPFAPDYRETEPRATDNGVGAPVQPAAITAGIHRLSSAFYHSDPAPTPSLSSTIAKLITSKSPLHAWHACRRLNPNYVSAERKTFDIGSAAHSALLGVGEPYIAIPEELLGANGASIAPIMEWYGAFYAGDRYAVFADGEKLAKDRNGCLVGDPA